MSKNPLKEAIEMYENYLETDFKDKRVISAADNTLTMKLAVNNLNHSLLLNDDDLSDAVVDMLANVILYFGPDEPNEAVGTFYDFYSSVYEEALLEISEVKDILSKVDKEEKTEIETINRLKIVDELNYHTSLDVELSDFEEFAMTVYALVYTLIYLIIYYDIPIGKLLLDKAKTELEN